MGGAVEPPQEQLIRSIKITVVKAFGILMRDLESRSRERAVESARQIAMYIARSEMSLSLSEIAGVFRRRLVTVLNAVETVDKDRVLLSQAEHCMRVLVRNGILEGYESI